MSANLRLFTSRDQYNDYVGYIADISTSGLRLVLDQSGPGVVYEGAQAKWCVRKKSGQDLDGRAIVVRSTLQGNGIGEIALQFDRVRHDVVRGLPDHSLVEVELNPLPD